jgi:anaerobic magnesium-protoporphyrin IX monomethyl ester cyclase
MEDSPRQYYSIVLCDFAKLDKDLIRKMKRAGIYWILFGVETFDDLERKQFGKRRHIVDDILKICYEEGMLTRAFVMLGIPGTTEEKLRKQKEQLYEKPFISNLRINFYTPFPGTPLWKEVKDKNILLTEKWEHFTTEEPTIACDVTPDKLKTFSEELVREYYSSDKYKKGIAWQIQHYPEIEEVYADAFALIDDPFPV